jgi:hypothetical protein
MGAEHSTEEHYYQTEYVDPAIEAELDKLRHQIKDLEAEVRRHPKYCKDNVEKLFDDFVECLGYSSYTAEQKN